MLFSLFLVTFPNKLLYFVCIRYLVVLQWYKEIHLPKPKTWLMIDSFVLSGRALHQNWLGWSNFCFRRSPQGGALEEVDDVKSGQKWITFDVINFLEGATLWRSSETEVGSTKSILMKCSAREHETVNRKSSFWFWQMNLFILFSYKPDEFIQGYGLTMAAPVGHLTIKFNSIKFNSLGLLLKWKFLLGKKHFMLG